MELSILLLLLLLFKKPMEAYRESLVVLMAGSTQTQIKALDPGCLDSFKLLLIKPHVSYMKNTVIRHCNLRSTWLRASVPLVRPVRCPIGRAGSSSSKAFQKRLPLTALKRQITKFNFYHHKTSTSFGVDMMQIVNSDI